MDFYSTETTKQPLRLASKEEAEKTVGTYQSKGLTLLFYN
jgi:hypothetical protein